MYIAAAHFCLLELYRRKCVTSNVPADQIAEASAWTERALNKLMDLFVELPDDHDGLCPDCLQPGYVRNIRQDNWAYCDEHKTKWLIGGNVYTDWQEETEAIWKENAAYLSELREVEPTFTGRGLLNRKHQETADALDGLIG